MPTAVDICFFSRLLQSSFRELVDCSLIRRRMPGCGYRASRTGVTKIGKAVYATQELAETDAKALCKEPKPKVPRENAE